MKLILAIEVSHDVLDVPNLLFALPSALDSVRAATSAGIGATGDDGMQVQVPGTDVLARVRFRLEYAETVTRIPTTAPPPAPPAPTDAGAPCPS